MPKPNTAARAFLVVGHRHWGKSRTLRAVTNGKSGGWIKLNGKWFFVRLMSNDDIPKSNPDSYREFVTRLDPGQKPLILLAYCPETSPYPIIRALAAKYELFMWVLRHDYHRTRTISADEINALTRFGTVECHEKVSEATVRAADFQRFITSNTE
jgi:hypothetical protein